MALSQRKFLTLNATLAAALLLSACTGPVNPEEVRQHGAYWQRTDGVSAMYLRGPKAQHQLNQDIASCVAETRELMRLGSIREASPPDDLARTGVMRTNYDTPHYDGPLHTEYLEFHDFESCMVYKGWERIDYVAPIRAERAANNFSETILGIEFPHLWGEEHADPRTDDGFND